MISKKTSLRVVSLLPSATELLCAIGCKDMLVGRSHEDNYPLDIEDRPVLTGKTTTTASSSPAAIDKEVSEMIAFGRSLYTIDAPELERLHPDVILTQDLCVVCAIDLVTVERLAARMPPPRPRVLSLNPQSLEDVLTSALLLGRALDCEGQAAVYVRSLEDRISRVKAVCSRDDEEGGGAPVKVGFIEWSDPIYVGGHWTPQLISYAGGEHTLNPAGEGLPGVTSVQVGGAGKSFPVSRDVFVSSDPDVVIVAPCGFHLQDSIREAETLLAKDWFRGMRAVRSGRLFAVDGDAMFNRPGPRLVDALEWLAAVLNPDNAEAVLLAPTDFPCKQFAATGASSQFSATSPGNSTAGLASDASDTVEVSIEEAHRAACAADEAMYVDPGTGYSVFTERAHLKRGKCCGNACRHCPFGHYNVLPDRRSKDAMVKTATLLRAAGSGSRSSAVVYDSTEPTASATAAAVTRVLFWSGGKDSYLTLRRLQRSGDGGRIVLLTTVEEGTGAVPHQGVDGHQVMDQSRALRLDLMLVPLPPQCGNSDYAARVAAAVQTIERTHGHTCVLVFGDLRLEDVVAWRRATFSAYQCQFPLLGEPYDELLSTLFADESISVTISAVANRPQIDGGSYDTLLKIGGIYDASLVADLAKSNSEVDAMGENGEFHTYVQFRQ